MTTAAPARASVSAMARPMPRLAPVTIAVCPSRNVVMLGLSRGLGSPGPAVTLAFGDARKELPIRVRHDRRHAGGSGMPARIVLVVAVAENGVIGHRGGMPWRLPTDLAHFRAVTLGKPVVMGRKTYGAIGRPLPGRDNIVVTRDRTPAIEGAHVVHSLEEALALGAELAGA